MGNLSMRGRRSRAVRAEDGAGGRPAAAQPPTSAGTFARCAASTTPLPTESRDWPLDLCWVSLLRVRSPSEPQDSASPIFLACSRAAISSAAAELLAGLLTSFATGLKSKLLPETGTPSTFLRGERRGMRARGRRPGRPRPRRRRAAASSPCSRPRGTGDGLNDAVAAVGGGVGERPPLDERPFFGGAVFAGALRTRARARGGRLARAVRRGRAARARATFGCGRSVAAALGLAVGPVLLDVRPSSASWWCSAMEGLPFRGVR